MKLFFVLFTIVFNSVTYAQTKDADKIQFINIIVDVNKDRSLSITEHYKFTAGPNIQHGLFRYLPIKYYSSSIEPYTTPLNIEAVLMDGKPSGYHTKHNLATLMHSFDADHSNHKAIYNKIIYVGHKDITLEPNSKHTITLKYTIHNVVKSLSDGEHIGWNLQGYDWVIDRDSLQLTVNFPQDFSVDNIYCIQGVWSRNNQFSTVDDNPHITEGDTLSNSTFNADINQLTLGYRFPKYEADVTVYARVPEGTFDAPLNGLARLWRDFKLHCILIMGLLISSLLWWLFWYRIGRDHKPQFIQALYGAPDNLDPSECRYFRYRTVDRRTLTALIVEASIKGFITIDKNTNNDFVLKKTDTFRQAPKHLYKVLNGMFLTDHLTIKSTSAINTRFNDGIKTLETSITDKYPNQYRKNAFVFLLGLLPIIAASICALFIQTPHNLGLLIMSFITAHICFSLFDQFLEKRANWKSYVYDIFGLLIIGTFIYYAPFFLYVDLIQLIIFTAIGISAGLWRYLMQNQTVISREFEMKVSAFEHYLRSTEERLMDFVNDPEEAPKLFERNLPYAIALNLELRWVQAFEKALDNGLLISDNLSWRNDAFNLQILSHSFTNNIETNSTYYAPSSKGSSWSGGGFSGGSFGGGGGGFGGGGGGGW